MKSPSALSRNLASLNELLFIHRCELCRSHLDSTERHICQSCQRQVFPQILSANLIHSQLGQLSLYFATSYSRKISPVILAAKEDNSRGARNLLCEQLFRLVQESVATQTRRILLIPAPSSTAASLRRGRRHMVELVRQVARESRRFSSLECWALPALRFSEHVVDQTDLTRMERQLNLQGKMEIDPRMRMRLAQMQEFRAVLVDDVTTTGATLFEMKRTLFSAGFEVNTALCVAASPLQFRNATGIPIE